MPQVTDEDRLVLEYVTAWYEGHRGALPASRVAEATGLPCETVRAAAGVLAVAAGLRISPARYHGGACDVLFIDAPPHARRVIDLTGADRSA